MRYIRTEHHYYYYYVKRLLPFCLFVCFRILIFYFKGPITLQIEGNSNKEHNFKVELNNLTHWRRFDFATTHISHRPYSPSILWTSLQRVKDQKIGGHRSSDRFNERFNTWCWLLPRIQPKDTTDYQMKFQWWSKVALFCGQIAQVHIFQMWSSKLNDVTIATCTDQFNH